MRSNGNGMGLMGMGLMLFAFMMMLLFLIQISSVGVVVVSEQELAKQRQRVADLRRQEQTAESFKKEVICKTVAINYQVEYGSIYTGDQTPIRYSGLQQLAPICAERETSPSIPNIPDYRLMRLTLNDGRRCGLWLPFFKLLNSEPRSFLQFDEGGGSVKMIVDAKTETAKDNSVLTIFIKARPATKEQWEKKHKRGQA